MAMSLQKALGEHEQLLAIARDLRRVVSGRVAPAAADALLRDFTARREDHSHHETRSVYEPVSAYAEEQSADFKSVLTGMLTSAASDWSSYSRLWSQERMESDWAGFGKATRTTLERGHAQLCLEEKVIYPLALKRGLIPLLNASR